MIEAAINGHIGVIRALLKVGTEADTEAYDHGNTPLLYAAKHDHANCVELLLKAGADVEMACFDDETALMFAAEGGHTKIVC